MSTAKVTEQHTGQPQFHEKAKMHMCVEKKVWKEMHQKLNRGITLDTGIKDDFYFIFYKKYVLCFNSVVLN